MHALPAIDLQPTAKNFWQPPASVGSHVRSLGATDLVPVIQTPIA
jgi:hypothetical protein